ncbi:MAG: 3-oxoacyl-[acyl-carrier-protein] synthase III C-terminal domain-containing protein, partial [Saprospiraceae bacterium]
GMNIKRSFCIKGVGKYLPKTIVSSQEIEAEYGLPKDWINRTVGVETRHIAKGESNTMMGVAALEDALEDAGLEIKNIDCLIAASATFDYVLPSRSSLLKNHFKEADDLDFPCLDINTVCTSFITALDYASHLLATSNYQNIAIVSSEISSKGLDPSNAETFCLFGDGAAAVILSRTKEMAGLINYELKTYSEGAKYTIIEGGGNANHSKDHPYNPQLFSFKMEGKKLLRSAMENLPSFFDNFFQKLPVNLTAIDWIIPHQASKMGMRLITALNGDNSKNIFNQLSKYGNCIAASIPLSLVLSIKQKKLKEGGTCMLIGTAAGMSISGMLLKYKSQ